MTIEQLKQWYNLQPEDFWQLRRGGKTITIITHNACEKIAEMVNCNSNVGGLCKK